MAHFVRNQCRLCSQEVIKLTFGNWSSLIQVRSSTRWHRLISESLLETWRQSKFPKSSKFLNFSSSIFEILRTSQYIYISFRAISNDLVSIFFLCTFYFHFFNPNFVFTSSAFPTVTFHCSSNLHRTNFGLRIFLFKFDQFPAKVQVTNAHWQNRFTNSDFLHSVRHILERKDQPFIYTDYCIA